MTRVFVLRPHSVLVVAVPWRDGERHVLHTAHGLDELRGITSAAATCRHEVVAGTLGEARVSAVADHDERSAMGGEPCAQVDARAGGEADWAFVAKVVLGSIVRCLRSLATERSDESA